MDSNSVIKYLNEIIASSHKFSSDLYQILEKESEDCFFSPLSIFVALALTYVGSKGKTAEEIEKYLHLPKGKDNFLQGVRLLLDRLKCPELNFATEIFIETTCGVRQDYKGVAKKYFDSESQLLDFNVNPRAAENYINSWVSTKTKEKINNLIPDGTLDKYTKMVLVNAIHFKDKWSQKFLSENTNTETFHITNEKSVEVPMMHKSGRFYFLQKDEFKVLQLPYENKDFKMIIILPHEIEGLSNLQEKLDVFKINDILPDLYEVKVRVTLPKFKVEKFIDLNDTLQKMGIETMFINEADFTGISTEDRLYVGNVLHKAFVEVDEEGTEAAAVTTVRIVPLCARISSEITYPFVADHPFLFYILYRDVILFMGKITCP